MSVGIHESYEIVRADLYPADTDHRRIVVAFEHRNGQSYVPTWANKLLKWVPCTSSLTSIPFVRPVRLSTWSTARLVEWWL